MFRKSHQRQKSKEAELQSVRTGTTESRDGAESETHSVVSKELEKRKLERKQVKDLANLKNHLAEQCEKGAEKHMLKGREHNVKIKEQFELFKEQEEEEREEEIR